jgi:hypothetical protein
MNLLFLHSRTHEPILLSHNISALLILSLLKYLTELWSKQIVKIVSLTLFFSKLLLIVFSKGSAGERTMENSEASLECLGTFHKLNFSSQLGLRTIDFLGFV